MREGADDLNHIDDFIREHRIANELSRSLKVYRKCVVVEDSSGNLLKMVQNYDTQNYESFKNYED